MGQIMAIVERIFINSDHCVGNVVIGNRRRDINDATIGVEIFVSIGYLSFSSVAEPVIVNAIHLEMIGSSAHGAYQARNQGAPSD